MICREGAVAGEAAGCERRPTPLQPFFGIKGRTPWLYCHYYYHYYYSCARGSHGGGGGGGGGLVLLIKT